MNEKRRAGAHINSSVRRGPQAVPAKIPRIAADPERGTVPSTTTEIANGVSCCEEAARPEELIEIDDDAWDEDDVAGTGAVSGGFGFAGLALAIVSLTTNWTSSVVVITAVRVRLRRHDR
jgi:hypothetical protein